MTENADVIFVGNKPPMSYVLAIITSAIGTAEMPPREGENKSRMVSTMEITLKK